MATDPYNILRRLSIGRTAGNTYTMPGELAGTSYEQTDPDTYSVGVPTGYGGKYLHAFRPEGAPEGVLQVTGIQQPGMHKYDTMSATYQLDPATGQYVMLGDPMMTRETSSQDRFQDFAEKGGALVGGVLGAGYGLSNLYGTGAATGAGAGAGGGAVGAGTAGSGIGTLGTIPAGSAGLSAIPAGGVGAATVPSLGAASGAIPTAAGTAIGGGAAAAGASGAGGGAGGGFMGISKGQCLNTGRNLLGGYRGDRASSRAADAQLAAGRESNDLMRYMYEQNRSDFAPYRQAGTSALGQIQNLLANPNAITQQPDYQFGLEQGMRALNNSAAARGMTYSGAQGKALQRYGQDYAGTKLNESYNRLASIAGIGQQATGSTAQLGQNAAGAIGNTLQGMGNARAGAYVGGANAWNNALGNIGNNWQMEEMMRRAFPGGGG